nr:hypothetical protein [Paraburkholderia mimosarum]
MARLLIADVTLLKDSGIIALFDEPALACGRIDAVMDARIVEHDHGRPSIALTNQFVEKALNVRPFDCTGACCVNETVLTKIQRAHHIASAMMIGLNGMGQSSW